MSTAMAARRLCLTALTAALSLSAPRASAQGRARPGDLSVELAFGRALTMVRNPTGRTASDVEAINARAAAGVLLGGGVWVEGTLRVTPDVDFTAVRWFSFGAGLRLDSSDAATLSTALRFGWSATPAGGLNHGGYASFGINLRPARALTLFAECGVEAYPGMTFERTTVNGRVREQSLVVGTVWYGGGLRFVL